MLGAIFLDFCDVVLFPAYPFSQDSSLHLPSHTRYTSVSFPFTFAQSFLPAFLLFLLFIIIIFFRNIIIVFLLTFVSHSRNVRFSPSFCFRLVFKFHNFSATSFNNFFQQVSCTCIQRTRVLCRPALSSRTYTFHTHTSIPKYVTSTYLHYTACDFLSLHFALLVV